MDETIDGTIKNIINSKVNDTIKCSALIHIVNENEGIYTKTLTLLGNTPNLLEQFLTEYEFPPTKRRKTIIANPASEWTTTELQYFMITFEDTDNIQEFCSKSYELTVKAKTFIDMNKNVTRKNSIGFTQQSALTAKTEFNKNMFFVINLTANESSVDDMMKSFLSNIMSDRFLIKTRFNMKLYVAKQHKSAIADLIAILFPQLYVGLIVVEDKPSDTSKTENQWENAEAQTIAEAIAVMQQKNWPKKPVFALRVLETYVTIYKLEYDENLLEDIKKGIKRNSLYVVKKFLPECDLPGERPGWDLSDPKARQILVETINNISLLIESEYHKTNIIEDLSS